jgi:hypothetical protein
VIVGGVQAMGWRGAGGGAKGNTTINPQNVDHDFRVETSGSLGENSFFVDGGSGKVGIGTDTPTAVLHVSGSDAAALFSVRSDSNIDLFTVTGSGQVGIGTPDPQTTLHIKAEVAQFRIDDTTTDYSYTIDCEGAKVVTHFGGVDDEDAFMSFGAYGGINRLDTSVRDFHLYGTTTTTGFYFDESAGMFGIGTDSPHSTMHASGSFAGAFTAFSSVTYTAGASHFILDYQGASNTDSVLTLPTPVGIAGRIYHILNNSAAGGTLKVETPAGAFLGANLENDSSDEVELEGDDSSRQMQSIMVCSTGANWFILHDGRRSEYDEHGP